MEEKYDPSTGEFFVYTIGIIFDSTTRKILIGLCKEDPNFPKLGWAFPAGRPKHDEELGDYLKTGIRESTGLEVENLGAVFARTYPENRKALSIYYLCEVTGGEEKADGEMKELKWVSPEELEDYFTTDPEVKEYIMNLK